MLFRSESRVAPPAVLVVHGDPGFPEYLQELCRRLVSNNLTALLIDWTKRFPPFPEAEAERAAWRKRVGGAALWRGAASDCDAGLRWLRARNLVSQGAAAGIGFCGGGVVLGHYAAQGAPLRALILFYANARLRHSFYNPDDPLPDLVDLAERVKVPVQAHYGLNDQVARPDDARDFERRLVAVGARPEFSYYPGAGHGFMQPDAALNADASFGFVAAAAAEAEGRLFQTLNARLR